MITNYTTLKTAVASWLNKADAATIAAIPEMIQLAEARFNRNTVIRKLVTATLTVDAESEALPTDFSRLDSLSHTGTNNIYGDLDTVGFGQLAVVTQQYGPTGHPRKVALIPTLPVGGVAWFAPPPDASYPLRISYWAGIAALSDQATTNWLLTAAPDVYMWGALAEAEPWLRNDERIAVWETKLGIALGEWELNAWDAQFSGAPRPQHRTFGG